CYGRNRQLVGIGGGYLSLPELRNKASDQCDQQKQCSARHQDNAMSSASPGRVRFIFVGARPDAAGIRSCAHIYRDVFRLRKRPPQGPLMEHFLSVLPWQGRLLGGATG